MIDLKPFCGDDTDARIKAPFSLGEFTYATNGHVMIRVARRDDVPEIERPPDVELALKPFLEAMEGDMRPLRGPVPPPAPGKECEECEGSGHEHMDCSDCSHKCPECDGTGTYEKLQVVRVDGGLFNARYLRLYESLPGLVVARAGDTGLALRFNEGIGAMMSMRNVDPPEIVGEL